MPTYNISMEGIYNYKVYQLDQIDTEEALIKALERIVREYNISVYSDGISYVVYGRDGKPLVSLSMGDLLIKE